MEGIKIHKIKENIFFLPTTNKLAIQSNPLIQLRLIYHKSLIKANWKYEYFKVLVYLAVFPQLRKLWKVGWGKFILFFWLFLSVHINFQYKLNSHKSLFIVIYYHFLLLITYFFLSPISLFFSLIFHLKLCLNYLLSWFIIKYV